MKNVKKLVFTIASLGVLSQSVMASESANLSVQAQVELNTMLADNIAEIKGTNAANLADNKFAQLETQLQTNLLVAEAVKSLPKAPKFKVVVAD